MNKTILFILLLFVISVFIACDKEEPLLTESTTDKNDISILKKSTANDIKADQINSEDSGVDLVRIGEMVDIINNKFEEAGSTWRLTEAWFFTVGRGTDPYMRLRTGSRWPYNDVTYVLDESDYTSDVSFTDADAALVSAFDSWNNIANSNLTAIRVPDNGGNFDILDGTYDGDGNFVFLYDLTSPNLDWDAGLIYPEADIVVGGWINPNYFSQGLGSSDIIGVTWTWSDVDRNGDNYNDRQYVEQFYNPAFFWVTSGSMYLDYGSGTDIETIAVHEIGHAHGLGHFGGPLENQPFKLKPNLRVFNPEAVMNPYYLNGEKRNLLPTDVAAMRTMYAR